MPKHYRNVNGVVFLTALPGGKYRTNVQHHVTEREAAKNATFRLRGKPDSSYWRSLKHRSTWCRKQPAVGSWLMARPGPPSSATCRAPPAGRALYRWPSQRAASPGSGAGGGQVLLALNTPVAYCTARCLGVQLKAHLSNTACLKAATWDPKGCGGAQHWWSTCLLDDLLCWKPAGLSLFVNLFRGIICLREEQMISFFKNW